PAPAAPPAPPAPVDVGASVEAPAPAPVAAKGFVDARAAADAETRAALAAAPPGDADNAVRVRGQALSRRAWKARASRVALLLAASLALASSGRLLPPEPSLPTSDAAAHPPTTETKRLAVLPFANLSGDPDEEYFSDGLTEELIAALSRVHSLSVVARSSAFAYRAPDRDVSAIGRALDVGIVVEGSVRRQDDRVRIWARLVDADNGVLLWSHTYDRELTDVFAVWADV